MREEYLMKVLTKWKVLQHCHPSLRDYYYGRFSSIIWEEPFVNHRGVLSTIILKQDEQLRGNMLARASSSQAKEVSPIQIYKDIPKSLNKGAELPKIKAVFSSLIEFAQVEKSDSNEILYLGLLKDLLQRMLPTEKDLKFQLIIDCVESRFSHNVIHVKESALRILADIFCSNHEQVAEPDQILASYGREYVDRVCRRIAEEVRYYVSNPHLETKLYGGTEHLSNNSRGKGGGGFSITPKANPLNIEQLGSRLQHPQSATNKYSKKFQFDPLTVSKRGLAGGLPIPKTVSPKAQMPEIGKLPTPKAQEPPAQPRPEPQKGKGTFKKLMLDIDKVNESSSTGGEQGYRLPK